MNGWPLALSLPQGRAQLAGPHYDAALTYALRMAETCEGEARRSWARIAFDYARRMEDAGARERARELEGQRGPVQVGMFD